MDEVLAKELAWQDKLDKDMIDHNHRMDIIRLGYCMACGLPHGRSCQCQTLREAMAGLKAEYR